MDNPDSSLSGRWASKNGRHEQGQAFEKWEQTPDGPLATTAWRAELFRELDIPAQAEIEVTVQSTEKPKLLLSFSDRPDDSVRIETWMTNLSPWPATISNRSRRSVPARR